MILKLPSVSLLSIDCFTPLKTLRAMEFSTKFVDFADVLLLTDVDRPDLRADHRFEAKRRLPEGRDYLWRADHLRTCGVMKSLDEMGTIRLIPHKESEEKMLRPDAPHHPGLPKDYELASMCEPIKHMQTGFILFCEWDAAVLNPTAWMDEFLKYDYIGAPWSRHHEPGWPKCDEHNCVGNAGASLRSRLYCQKIAEACELFKNDPARISCDMWPARSVRPWLESQGVKFAPPGLAYRFSCENQIYSGQFMFHGKYTALLNNWGGELAHVRP